jgi:hypothetical protein
MNSLRKIQLLAAFISIAFVSQAQVSIGVKMGVNMADTRVDGLIESLLPEQTVYPGFTAGIMAEIPLKSGFAFRPELNYIQKGFITEGSLYDLELLGIDIPIGAKAKTRFNHIEMPLLMKYSIGSDMAKVYFIAGPNISYAANAHVRPVANLLLAFNLPKVNINLDNDIYRRFEVSGTIGAGGEFKAGAGKIFADARYTMGFTNLFDNPIVDVRTKNQGINISAGYAYVF